MSASNATITLGTIHMKRLRYKDLVSRLRRLIPGREMNAKIVEACLLNAVQTCLTMRSIRGPTASAIIDEARKVTAQGSAYWSGLADVEPAADEKVEEHVQAEPQHKS